MKNQKTPTIRMLVKSNMLLLVGGVLGGIGGYFYWKIVGCNSGTCIITSNPLNSTLYGTLMGGLLSSLFQTDKKPIEHNLNKEDL